MLHLSYNENTILDTFTADSPNPRQFVLETVTTNKNRTYDDDDGTNIKFVPMPEDPEKAVEFQLSKIKTDNEDEQPLVKKRKPLNLTITALEEAAENEHDMDDLD